MTRGALLWASLLVVAASCGGDEKQKEPKTPTAAERAERVCKATCARNMRCDEGDDEEPLDEQDCLWACRRDRTARMHVVRHEFASAYADCLDQLGCKEDPTRCREVAIATLLLGPEEETDADDAAKKAKGAGDGASDAGEAPKDEERDADEAPNGDKKGPSAKKAAKKDPRAKKDKKDPKAEKKRKEAEAAAVTARELFRRCHDRRMSCDETWDERCNAAVALNDGGRERVRECLRLPCSQIRRCLQDAVSW